LGSRLDQLKARETKVTVGSVDGDGDGESGAARAPRSCSVASAGAALLRLRFLAGEVALGDDGGELAGELASVSGEGQMCPFFGS
jgi:hypothetical protein